MKYRLISILLVFLLLLTGCGDKSGANHSAVGGSNTELGGFNDSFGDELANSGIYDGKFTEVTQQVVITCLSGTTDAYTVTDGTILFSGIKADSVYSISGQFNGNIIIEVDEDYRFELEMQGFSLISATEAPIVVLGGDKVILTAKKGSQNYIYDDRPLVDENDENQYSSAIYSMVDLQIGGKGSLTLVSEYNKGIHGKDDLIVKNLTLFVACTDNALKGNDSVQLQDANTTLIATYGDGIKTANSGLSEKGNQRGTISITGGTHIIYAACDGLDAAYDVLIDGETTALTIYTDKYSNYSGEVTATDSDTNYIRFTSDAYQYSVKYYNSDKDYQWVDAQYHSAVSSGRMNYYYYSYPKMDGYSKVQFFIYSSDQAQSQDEDFLVCSELLSPNEGSDTFALSARGNQLTYEWTNYTTIIQENFGPGGMGGLGGMGEGNPDKGDHSTKGIKAANQIVIENGIITIKAYDDAIHANNDSILENGETPSGNIIINGGNISVYSNDDGLHADGDMTINGGNICIVNSYEGVEGAYFYLNGGSVSIIASDDGINSTATTGAGVTVNSGILYIYCSGDGIDANSRDSYTGILFNGGNTVVISTSGGNSSIDTERGYTYNGGNVLAIMPSGGMSSEATHCMNFASVATNKNLSLTSGKYVSVSVDGKTVVSAKLPTGMNAIVIYLGSNSASISLQNAAAGDVDSNGVYWNSIK